MTTAATTTSSNPPAAKKAKIEAEKDTATHDALAKIEESLAATFVEEEKLHRKITDEQSLKRIPLWQKRGELAKKINHFWSIAMENHPMLGSLIQSADAPVLETLENIELEFHNNHFRHCTIHFYFSSPNAFLEDPHLKKELKPKDNFYDCDPEKEDEFVEEINTPISWKEGKDVTKIVKKPSNEVNGNNNTSSRKRGHDQVDEDEEKSFFEFFTSTDNYDIASIIMLEFYPKATAYYQGGESDDESDGDEELGEDDSGDDE